MCDVLYIYIYIYIYIYFWFKVFLVRHHQTGQLSAPLVVHFDPAVEMEMNDFGDEDSASSGGLVVRVREVVPGSLELTLTIGDANGDYPEVSRANTMRDANHPVCTQEVRR